MSERGDDAPKVLEEDDAEGLIFVRDFPPIRTPDPESYLEWSGVRQMTIVLVIICVAVVGFLAAWALTVPTIEDVRALAGGASPADPQAAAELLDGLREGHMSRFRDLFQLLVMSALVPLFTLLAGYVFGKSSSERRRKQDP
ncbi:MAG TPA: hypothetical protein VGG06_04340 [Thermoanaerobaculia bacterium]|jgi:hypothetical protein